MGYKIADTTTGQYIQNLFLYKIGFKIMFYFNWLKHHFDYNFNLRVFILNSTCSFSTPGNNVDLSWINRFKLNRHESEITATTYRQTSSLVKY